MNAGTIQDSIGFRFENYLQETYPDLIWTARNSNVPDFYHPSGFWIEAKAGNVRWGGRIKRYQMSYNDLEDPLTYAFGMHNFDRAKQRLYHTKEGWRQRCLRRHMEIIELYFVSGDIVNKVLVRDEKISKKKGKPYTMVKPSTLRNIILERKFRRGDDIIDSAEDYYGFDRRNYSVKDSGPVQYFLHSEKEQAVIDFLGDNPQRNS